MNELRPCPFCGSEYAQVRYMGFRNEVSAVELGWRGECCECGALTRAFDTEQDAIKVWNTRDGAFTREDVEGAFVSGYSLGMLPVGSDPQWDENVQTVDEHMAELGWVRERTCHNTSHRLDESRFHCSVCWFGCWVRNVADGRDKLPKYCPNCGAKVVSE